ncbi:MAG TPA: LPXTG cell wall anchor domain-containing protein [Actinomycetota bacterium]|jgi:LPXTG-motif cell wall-anchored protein
MTNRRRRGQRQGLSKRFFYALLGVAGLGVGVWLFRSRRRKNRPTP